MKKLLVVDGNSILNRAFYGIRILTNNEGFPTNALYGMVNILSKQIEALSPDYLAVAFDLKAPTFRHKLYSGYKANRKPMPPELAQQMPYAKELCQAMGFTVLEKEGYEADDILGTLSAIAKSEDETEAYILTGDRDSLQLITEDSRVKVLLAGNTETTLFDGDKFKEKYGVSSTVFVDVKALMGDSSDNIPGVAGIGEKTALKLISDNGTLSGVYENLETAQLSPSVKKKLIEGKDSAFLSLELAKINCEVPLEYSLSDMKNQGFDREKLSAMFTKFGFSTLLKKFQLDEVAESTNAFVEPDIITTDNNILEKIELQEDKTITLYCANGEISIFDGKKTVYSTSDPSLLRPIFEQNDIRIITYDAKSLYKVLQDCGIYYRSAYSDIMLASYVLNAAAGKFDLDRLALEYISLASLPEKSKGYVIYKIHEAICQKMKEDNNLEKLLYEIEMPLAAVLADMEIVGFRTDAEGLRKYGDELDTLAEDLEKRIYFSAGCEFNINSPMQLGEVLFDKLGLPAQKKTKTGGYSTGAEILEKLRPYHPIIEDILEYRKVTKLKSTYVEGLIKVADENGRVHSCFNQTGTATGRLSSSEPNLQNIPIRTELGRELRKFFVPKNNDYVLIDADYSQIELRVLASISEDKAMTEAFISGEDIHASTAAKVFSVPASAVTGEMRKRAKAINFGIVYGMGEFSLSEDLGISRAQAKKYIESYFAGYPAISAYLEDVVKSAYENGYVTTLFGRRRYIPELAGQNKNLKHFGERVAKNSPIQGTAADIIKIAMINTAKKLKDSGIDARLILQVHDELIIEASRDCATEAAKILEDCMENAIKLSVPLVAKASIGETWFDNK
ncbi:MAG: DNA polymerase I [Clostridia bacterium]|nr:DNA polymerase I [Clostridia bacterium]